MGKVVSLPFVGTDLYCPDCKRHLVTVRQDGTMAIAGLAGVNVAAEVAPGEVIPQDAVVVEATCYRRSCRLKRWLRREKRN